MKKTENLLDAEAVLHKRAVSRAQHYQDVKDGVWSKPVRASGTRVGWLESECDALIAAYAAGWADDRIKELVGKLHAKREAKAAAIAARFKMAA